MHRYTKVTTKANVYYFLLYNFIRVVSTIPDTTKLFCPCHRKTRQKNISKINKNTSLNQLQQLHEQIINYLNRLVIFM